MKHYEFVLIISFLLVHSCNSFSPQPRRLARGALHYADVAERVAIDTQQNVKLFDSPYTKSTKAWQSLIPLIPGERGADVTVQWTTPQGGSELLLKHLFPNHPKTRQELQPLLQESFATFQSLLPSYDTFKARVVATRGPRGTKCPRWHVDHVPQRWIQALVGPGCDYVVGGDGIHWNAINGLEEVSSDEANRELVDEEIADVRHAPQGQGVVLWGAENDNGRLPAVHKSPTCGPFQGRVLLTLDVVRD